MGKTILLVDDEDFFRDRLKRAFVNRGFTVFEAADYNEAVAEIKENSPDMAVIDLRMPGKSGLDVVREAKRLHPDISIVVLTGYGSIATATEAIKSGANSYLPKPADVDEILRAFCEDNEDETIDSDKEFETPSLARAEWEHINRVLTDCNGNISEAAKRLGLHRRTLQRKLYKYAPDK
jgi:two-component system response regulator RegA